MANFKRPATRESPKGNGATGRFPFPLPPPTIANKKRKSRIILAFLGQRIHEERPRAVSLERGVQIAPIRDARKLEESCRSVCSPLVRNFILWRLVP
jgi:hypothetical protein